MNQQSFFNQDRRDQQEDSSFNSKRENFMVDIRKKERNDIVKRKRQNNAQTDGYLINQQTPPPYHYILSEPNGNEIVDHILNTYKETVEADQINNYVRMVREGNRIEQFTGIIKLRYALSIEHVTPIQQVIDTNVVPDLIQIINKSTEQFLRIESCWCLTNIATGTNHQVRSLVEKGIIPMYVKLLHEEDINMLEQAVWGVGNIAGDCVEFRDIMLKNGCMQAMVSLYEKIKFSVKRSFISQLLWASSNLCRLKPAPEVNQIYFSAKMFCEGIKTAAQNRNENKTENQTLIDCSWALSQISSPDTIRTICSQDIMPTLLHLLDDKQLVMLHPVLRIVGTISNSTEDLSQLVIDYGFLDKFAALMSNTSKHIKKEVMWIVSNLTAGTREQIQAILDARALFTHILQESATGDAEVKREAVWSLCNMTKHMDASQLSFLLAQDILKLFMEVIKSKDGQLINLILEALYEIMAKAQMFFGSQNDKENPLIDSIEQIGLADVLSDLQNHPSEMVFRKSQKLLQAFWVLDDEWQKTYYTTGWKNETNIPAYFLTIN